MRNWIEKLDAIIQLNGKELLTHAGKISHQLAVEKSNSEYNKYQQEQKKIDHENNLRELEQDIKQSASAQEGKL